MNGTDLAAAWLKVVGKENVQDFQDHFSAIYDVSMCLLSLSGEPLTVWSNESLLCHYLSEQGGLRCSQVRKSALDKMLEAGRPVLEECHMGISSYFCPVFVGDDIAAAFQLGKVNLSGEENEMCRRFYVPQISGQKLEELMGLLNCVLSMMRSVLIPKQQDGATQLQLALMERYGLSGREASIAEEIFENNTNKDIAERLYISEKTVKTHVSSILRKMQVKDRTQVMLVCSRLTEQGKRSGE